MVPKGLAVFNKISEGYGSRMRLALCDLTGYLADRVETIRIMDLIETG
jgi:hypothetical protein